MALKKPIKDAGITAILTLMVAFLFLWSPAVLADDEVAVGKGIAEKLCARCHAIYKEGESTMKAAPPFRNFSKNWPLEALEEALAEGIVTGHPDMPEFKLEAPDVGAFILYLKTLE